MPINVSLSPGLRNLDERLRQRVAQAQTDSKAAIQREIRSQIEAVGAVASRQLYDSVRELETREDGATIGSDTAQAQYVEEGRRPGKVPPWRIFRPILEAWARSKGLNFGENGLYLVARKIAREGFEGRYPFRKAADAVQPKVKEIFERALKGL